MKVTVSRFLWPYRDVNYIIRLHVNCIIRLLRHCSFGPVSDIRYICHVILAFNKFKK